MEFFGRMKADHALECLRDMLKYNPTNNLRIVVEIAKKWNEKLSFDALIQLFEEFRSQGGYTGLFYYLEHFVNTTEDPNVVFKFIEAGVQLNKPPSLEEVKRVCRDNKHYDPLKVKEFLLAANLKDPRPLIHVCDRFDFVEELTQYLYSNQLFVFIEAYVQRMNVKAAPPVVGALLDLNAPDDQIMKLIDVIRPPPDDPDFVGRLCESVEKRNRLKMLRKFLEDRNNEGSDDHHVHNGLAKLYVDINNGPQTFLNSNKFYDSDVVGAYCESRDPHLAFIAYKRAGGACDQQLINVTNKNGFFKDQARYLVERQDLDLWETVLADTNEYRRQLIDQVVATALPESRSEKELSTTVKAFINSKKLDAELIELLERIILHGPASGEFHNNKNLQNLLILTAMRSKNEADKNRVKDYIKRLENYDGYKIAEIALSEQYQLFEEAFFIYKKFNNFPEAIGVLLNCIDDVPRAVEFAEEMNPQQKEVWSILAGAQLKRHLVREAIVSYLKAEDATQYAAVMEAARTAEFFDEMIQYIRMARQKTRDAVIDNELIYCFAKTEKLSELEEFINGPNVAKLNEAGDRCFEQKLYHAAQILYNHVNNNGKLAVCFVMLEQWQDAVNAARKASAIATWKTVCFACVDHEQFRLAQICGVHIIVMMDHLTDLVRHYERLGHFDELITLLEQGTNLDRAHQGIFTQLGICYCKYKEEKIMDHVKMYHNKLNIPTLLTECQESCHFEAVVYLHRHYDQFDQAVEVLMYHSSECWNHDLFKETLKQASNNEMFYKAIEFYIAEHPLLLTDLLMEMTQMLDATRVVGICRKNRCLGLVHKYLLHVQHDNSQDINDAINELCVEAEDFAGLRASIDQFDQFEAVSLAHTIEKHELVEFRRIAAHLYRLNKRWDKSIELSKKDGMWKDVIETAAQSGNSEMAENLLYFFVQQGEKECFAATLFTCYPLLRPDVVLECAWRRGLTDFAMPFMIQAFRTFSDELSSIKQKFADQEEVEAGKEAELKKAENEQAQTAAAYVGANADVYNPMMAPLMIAPPPGSYGMGMGAGMQMGMGAGMQMGMGGMQNGRF